MRRDYKAQRQHPHGADGVERFFQDDEGRAPDERRPPQGEMPQKALSVFHIGRCSK